MSDVASILIEDARQGLLREIEPAAGRNDLYEAFAAWLVPGAVFGLEMDGAVRAAAKASDPERQYMHVAALSLAAQARRLSKDEQQSLTSGLRWMVGRDPVVGGTPMPFCMDAVALAAIILGAKAAADGALWTQATQWIRKCRQATAGGQGLGAWQERLLAEVAAYTGLEWMAKGDGGRDAAEVRVALRSRGIVTDASIPAENSDETEVLRLIRTPAMGALGVPHAAIRLAALDWVRRDRPICDTRAVSVVDVGNLLRRIPFGLKKWTWESIPRTKASSGPRRWHVDNEYHVQNLLWLLLAPVFPDLVDEDATPKVGPMQPRADLGIPSLRLIVEAKFMRSGDPPKKVVEQIAVDASVYLVPGSKYNHLIPFVWDDSRRSEHHDEMVRGMRLIRGVADAIVISRPGSMDDGGA